MGGGALFFALSKALPKQPKAFISDENERLIDAYLGIAENVEEVIQLLKLHRECHNEEYFYEIRATIPESLLERAARIIYLNKTCYNGLFRENSQGIFNVPYGRYENPQICDEKNLRAVSHALKKAKITSRGFETVVDKAEEGDFVYFDPPYHPVSQTARFTNYNKSGFGEDAQVKLANVVGELHKKGVKVMLSNSDTEFIRDCYERDNIFKVQQVFAKRNVNSRADKRGQVAELLITNFDEFGRILKQMPRKIEHVSKKSPLDELYLFLQEKAKSGKPFTVDEWMERTTHARSTAKTYISKQLKDYIHSEKDNKYSIKRQFTRLDHSAFRQLVSQKERALSEYRRVSYDAFLTFEFLMPFTHETELRQTLDSLFYEDTLRRRIDEIGLKELGNIVPRQKRESKKAYLERVLLLLSSTFGGYSIFTATGRYLGASLLPKSRTAGTRYLIDETTAVVRFMIPVSTSKHLHEDGKFDLKSTELRQLEKTHEEISQIRQLFFAFFVEVVVSVVQGEDEIWLVESGLDQRLYVFEKLE